MDSNGRPIKNNFTSKININNNNIEGVKDIIIADKPISQTIDDFKNQDINILERLLILENNSNIMSSRISYLEIQNIKLKSIIYNLVNIN
jgi:hypothetical protein